MRNYSIKGTKGKGEAGGKLDEKEEKEGKKRGKIYGITMKNEKKK